MDTVKMKLNLTKKTNNNVQIFKKQTQPEPKKKTDQREPTINTIVRYVVPE